MQDVGNLNEAQKKAVLHVDGPLLVLAGAGSGKTKVVTHRIANLLQMGIPPSKIVAVTFTNKAAEEMMQRVKTIVETSVLSCTFHSLGVRILRESIEAIGYNSSFSIYDEKDSLNLLKTCLEALGMKDEKGTAKTLKTQISGFKNALISPEDVGSDDKFLLDVYSLYQERLKEYNALDFDDLLYLTVKVLEKDEVRKKYQNRWQYLLVDEYQDTNLAQYTICKYLVEKTSNIFVVGDPDQSIYSWRGANIDNILNFERDFPGATTITLDQNYRSTNRILKAANSLICLNPRPFEKNLWSSLGDGEKVHIQEFSSDRDEAREVSAEIAGYMRDTPLNEIVVFYRTNAQSRLFEDHLLRIGVPYVIIGGLSFYQRKEIKDILAFLKLALSPSDYISFTRTINLPKRGFGPKALLKLKTEAENKGLPILEACRIGSFSISAKQKENLSSYLSIFDEIQEMERENMSISEIIRRTITLSGYDTYIKQDKESYEDRSENIDELIAKAYEWEEEVEEPSLTKFLEELSLKGAVDEVTGREEAVRLMTIHNSKGLEFSICFLVGMEENLFPHVNVKGSPHDLEEERRLCYVGMTRAKKILHLTYSRYRFIWGAPKVMNPSRFLKEISKDVIDSSLSEEESFTNNEESEALSIGSTVFHKNFGKGEIQKAYQTSMGLTYDVFFFQDGAARSLLAKYAKLTSTPL